MRRPRTRLVPRRARGALALLGRPTSRRRRLGGGGRDLRCGRGVKLPRMKEEAVDAEARRKSWMRKRRTTCTSEEEEEVANEEEEEETPEEEDRGNRRGRRPLRPRSERGRGTGNARGGTFRSKSPGMKTTPRASIAILARPSAPDLPWSSRAPPIDHGGVLDRPPRNATCHGARACVWATSARRHRGPHPRRLRPRPGRRIGTIKPAVRSLAESFGGRANRNVRRDARGGLRLARES